MKINLHDSDPKKRGKKISAYTHAKETGLLDYAKKIGGNINPTHDFELLKKERKNTYKKLKNEFISERNLDKVKTTIYDLNCLYVMWLKDELKVINMWLSDKFPNGKIKSIKASNSIQIEVMKYNHFVNNELKKYKLKIAPKEINKKPVTQQINEGSKYYSDKEFAIIIDELLAKEEFEVNDLLEYHLSRAFVSDSMSKFNWLTSLRKNLIRRFSAPKRITEYSVIPDPTGKTPSQINMAFQWERNKSATLANKANKRMNKNSKTITKSILSIPQIALIFCYEGKAITRANGDKTAKEYGHNSGERLFQKFTFYSSTQNRKGKPFPSTPRKFQNKISLLESVIENLSNTAKPRAKDELKALKTLFKNIE